MKKDLFHLGGAPFWAIRLFCLSFDSVEISACKGMMIGDIKLNALPEFFKKYSTGRAQPCSFGLNVRLFMHISKIVPTFAVYFMTCTRSWPGQDRHLFSSSGKLHSLGTMKHFNSIVLLFLPLLVAAQPQDFANDMPFFQSKAALYQRWLDTTGLGQALAVESVRFAKNPVTDKTNTQELELYLLLRDTHPDKAIALWKSAEKNFLQSAGRPLRAELFQTFAHNMEIPPEQGNVQIYINDSKGNKRSGFFIWVWYADGAIRDSMLSGSKAYNFEVTVPPVKITNKVAKGKTTTVTKVREANEVFDIIMAFARELYPYGKYEGSDCAGRHPVVVEEKRTDGQLVFTVTDLCREALKNSELSIWCKVAKATGWQKDCNDIKRERLVFTFDYIRNGTDGGYRLQCNLVGKFGSGVYVPRTSGYMDMDPDFLSFEKDYAIWFQNMLKSRL